MDAIPPFVFLILVLALLAMAAGLGIWLFTYATGDQKRASKPIKKTTEDGESSTPTGIPAGMPTGTSAGTGELLSVYRMEENDELAVFVQGQRYDHLREIRDRQLGGDVVEAIKCVMVFAEGWLPALRQEPSQLAPAKPIGDEPAQLPEAGETFLEQLRQSDLFPVEKKPPGLLDGLARRQRRQVLDPLLTPADAINSVIQQRLEGRPDLARHNIRLTTGQDGGLRFHVGLQIFAAAEEISDSEIREFVQDAIQEWRES
jgi:hypothetical protein